tara:strand:+ start:106 stop:414 length:309 start_codon:yes stop_codon:yes gene_type:complete
MEIWYKENTGLKNPQERNLDYFVIQLIGADYQSDSSGATVLFYEFLEDAQQNKIAPASRTFLWKPMLDSIALIQAQLFSFESIISTSGDSITLQNPTEQPNE